MMSPGRSGNRFAAGRARTTRADVGDAPDNGRGQKANNVVALATATRDTSPKAAVPDSATGLMITIATLLAFQILGDALVQVAGVPIPGAVVGLGLFLAYLVYRGSIPSNISNVVPILLRHLSLLFIPAGVGVMAFFSQLSSEWQGLALTIAASTTLTLVVTATVFTLTSRLAGSKTPAGGKHEQ